jgi:hypothetical protein
VRTGPALRRSGRDSQEITSIGGIGFSWGLYFIQFGIAAQYSVGRDRPAWLESAVFTLAVVIPLDDACASAMIGCGRRVPNSPTDDGRTD